ncbi:hypothetical protein D3C71_1860000 [compost metagenome]
MSVFIYKTEDYFAVYFTKPWQLLLSKQVIIIPNHAVVYADNIISDDRMIIDVILFAAFSGGASMDKHVACSTVKIVINKRLICV